MAETMASSAPQGKWIGPSKRTGECEMGAKFNKILSQCIRTDPGRSNFWDFTKDSEKGRLTSENILSKEISRIQKEENRRTYQQFPRLEKWNSDGRPEKDQNLTCRPSDSGTGRLLMNQNVNVQEYAGEPSDENTGTCQQKLELENHNVNGRPETTQNSTCRTSHPGSRTVDGDVRRTRSDDQES